MREQIKCFFGGAEIGVAEDGVGAEDGGESHAREVMALTEHLRSDQRLRLLIAEAIEDSHERTFFSRGIAIENIDGDRRKLAAKALLDFFGAETNRLQDFASARRAFRRQRLSEPAVVTNQQSRTPVDGQRHAAFPAAKIITTFTTQ